ncbi:arrestin domain-containing protein 3-like [Xyrichtys novacula]|uniref:Arrestin domain-containing protein 3-like n=1 Tax=Xyrichtys novacula TaxID=13765 RepID=A0AAV1G5G0_XYRNO|nr:arrestin domain-containing protein 3-like [Xyrichtys novacula]
MFQSTIKNFSIQFNPLNERNTVSGGDLVTGHISFELTKQTKITSITMAMKGKANVHWTRGGGGKNKSRRHYSARLDFFNLKSAILQENSISGEGTKLEPGTHMYPFSCQLPHGDFPPSFKGPCGQITYALTVGINRPWHMSKDFIAELNFVNRIDTSQPELWAPLSGSNSKTICCLCCASGPITMTVSTERKAFIPGEVVKVIGDFSNASSRTVTPKVKLLQKQAYYTHNRVSSMVADKWLVHITGHPINAFTSDVHNEIMLTIPPFASPSILNCSILEVQYFIQVSLCASFSSDLTVLIPIILCKSLTYTQPPPYL